MKAEVRFKKLIFLSFIYDLIQGSVKYSVTAFDSNLETESLIYNAMAFFVKKSLRLCMLLDIKKSYLAGENFCAGMEKGQRSRERSIKVQQSSEDDLSTETSKMRQKGFDKQKISCKEFVISKIRLFAVYIYFFMAFVPHYAGLPFFLGIC